MSFETCLIKARAAAKGAGAVLTEDELKEIATIRSEQLETGKMSGEEFRDVLRKKFVDTNSAAASSNKNKKLLALKKLTEVSRSILARSKTRTLSDNIRDFIEGGGLEAGEGTNRDVLDIAGDFENRFRKALDSVMSKEDIKAASIGNQQLEREIYMGSYLKQNGVELNAANRKLYGISETAGRIVDSTHAAFNKMLQYKQAYNPHVETAHDYLIKRFHDADKIRGTEKAVWVQDALASFGEKSFPGLSPEAKAQQFGNLYDDLVAGHYYMGTGKGNIAKRLAERRGLVANSPTAAADYNAKYGYGSYYETVDRVIQQTARDVALMNKFGDPDTFLDLLVELVENNATPEELVMLNRDDIRVAYYRATHLGGDIAVRGLGRTVDRVKTLKYLTAGGRAGLRSIQDIGTTIGLLNSMQTGSVISGDGFKTLVSNAFDVVTNFAKFMSNRDELEEFLSTINMYSNAARSEIMTAMGANPYSNATGLGGSIDRAGHAGSMVMGKLSLLRRVNDALRSASTLVYSKNFAANIERGLDAHQLKEIARYGIGPAELEVFKSTMQTVKTKHGEIKIVTGENIDLMSDAAVTDYGVNAGLFASGKPPAPSEIARVRIELSSKLGTMYGQVARISTSTPGTRNLAFMYGTNGKDSVKGAISHLFWQFRGSSMSTVDAYRRVWASGEGLSGKMAGAATLAAFNASLYAIGEAASQMLEGKVPESPTSPEMLLKIAIGSGFSGMAGDAIGSVLMDSNPSVGSFMKGLAGTTLTGIAQPGVDAWKLGKAAFEGKNTDPKWSNLFKSTVLDNTPFLRNLPVVSGMWNFYAANELRNLIDSGFLAKQELRMSEKTGVDGEPQRYWLPK